MSAQTTMPLAASPANGISEPAELTKSGGSESNYTALSNRQQSKVTLTDFLAAFFPDANENIYLRSFKPKDAPDSPDNRPKKYVTTRGSLPFDQKMKNELKTDNKTRGLYFIPNAGGNSDSAITRFNAFFVENDQLPLAEQQAKLDAAPIKPNIRIVTRKSVHAYWLHAGDCTEAEWRDIQARLIAYFCGDPAIKNPSRCMRLPHFNHVAYEADGYSYKPIEIVEFQPEPRYRVVEMRDAFPAVESRQDAGGSYSQSNLSGASTQHEVSGNPHADLKREIMLRARRNSQGKYEMRCPAHNGKGETSLFYNPETDAFKCRKGCSTADLRRAFGLPERYTTANTHLEDKATHSSKTHNEAVTVRRMSDVKPEDVTWLWHPYIPFGKLTIIEGDPGVGKSYATCALATAVTNGRGLPGVEPSQPRNVLLLSAEDGLSDTLRPRLDSMKADASRIFAVDGALVLDADGLQQLEGYIKEYNPALVVIDPLFAYTGGKVDIYRDNEARGVLNRLKVIAEQYRCAMITLRHLTKQQSKATYAGGGSIAFTAAARSVLLFGRDNEGNSGFVQTKNNLAPQGSAVGYEIEGGQFLWTGESDLTASKILALSDDNGAAHSKRADAEDFLLEALQSGAVESGELQRQAAARGIALRTLRRAKDALGIRSERVTTGGQGEGRWLWELAA